MSGEGFSDSKSSDEEPASAAFPPEVVTPPAAPTGEQPAIIARLVAPHGLGFREYLGVVGIVTSLLHTTARRHLERCAPSLHTKHHECDTENLLQKSEKSEKSETPYRRIPTFPTFGSDFWPHVTQKSEKSEKRMGVRTLPFLKFPAAEFSRISDFCVTCD